MDKLGRFLLILRGLIRGLWAKAKAAMTIGRFGGVLQTICVFFSTNYVLLSRITGFTLEVAANGIFKRSNDNRNTYTYIEMGTTTFSHDLKFNFNYFQRHTTNSSNSDFMCQKEHYMNLLVHS